MAQMTSTTDAPGPEPVVGWRRYVPLGPSLLALGIALLIPLKIISYGYLPGDDALRHAAKAVCGKPWPEIVVLGGHYTVDHNRGWHLLLGQVHQATGCGVEALVLGTVVGLFALMAWSALPWLRRPEAWLVTLLLVVGVGSNFLARFLLGRPFLLTLAGLLTILFVWQRYRAQPPNWRIALGLTLLLALAVFVHGVWYLWVLPVVAFFLAGQFAWGFTLAACWVAGSFLGAALTGHPVAYLVEAIRMAIDAVVRHAPHTPIVTEFKPTPGNLFGLLLMGGVVVLRSLAKLETPPLRTNPAFWLACMGWVLGYQASRFWEDWGLPALMVLMAGELEALLGQRLDRHAPRRLALSAGLAAALYLACTNDLDNRWSHSLDWQYLEESNPALAGWLPGKGGTFYTTDLSFFYTTFYKNPFADWRYILGFEPALMPEEDLKTLQRIQLSNGDIRAYQPWLDKMGPNDRLVIRGDGSRPPPIRDLEWKYAIDGIWLGRKPARM